MTCAVFLSAFSITVVSLERWSFSSLLIHCKYNVVYIYNKVIFVPACNIWVLCSSTQMYSAVQPCLLRRDMFAQTFCRVIDTMTCAVFLSAFSITVVSQIGRWSFSSLQKQCWSIYIGPQHPNMYMYINKSEVWVQEKQLWLRRHSNRQSALWQALCQLLVLKGADLSLCNNMAALHYRGVQHTVYKRKGTTTQQDGSNCHIWVLGLYI